MTGAALALVIASAAMHVTWNALAKRSRRPLLFLYWALLLSSAALAIPAVAVVVAGGMRLSVASLWPIAATAAIHAVYFCTLARAYRLGDFSAVYPIARGGSVAIVAVASAPLLGQSLSVAGFVGVAAVCCGSVLIAWTALLRRRDGARRSDAGQAMLWAGATAVLIAAYSVVDSIGVSRVHPVPYIAALGLGTALLLLPVMWPLRADLVDELSRHKRAVGVAAVFNLSAYLLVLFAFRLSKSAYVVAARELSIGISIVVGVLWLRERPGFGRIAGATAVIAGVAMLALARS